MSVGFAGETEKANTWTKSGSMYKNGRRGMVYGTRGLVDGLRGHNL
jgi:hypothetical protein